MKATLIYRGGGDYKLYVNETTYATTSNSPYKKLSKQNCDEIFRVVDVEKLAKEETIQNEFNSEKSYIKGFNKAMELNKDKLFTEFDIIKAFEYGWNQRHFDKTDENELREIQKRFIQSLQQPTEIEVEIEMKKVVDETKIVGSVKEVKGSGNKITTYKSVPKLDVNGCLILKRI
jgi:hypothetical protein